MSEYIPESTRRIRAARILADAFKMVDLAEEIRGNICYGKITPERAIVVIRYELDREFRNRIAKGPVDEEKKVDFMREYVERVKPLFELLREIKRGLWKDPAPDGNKDGKESPHPEYIHELINAGKLYPDGVRVVRRLEDVAAHFVQKGMEPSRQFIKETFRKADGKPYADKTIEAAMEMARAK